jgi:hypothetical protein
LACLLNGGKRLAPQPTHDQQSHNHTDTFDTMNANMSAGAIGERTRKGHGRIGEGRRHGESERRHIVEPVGNLKGLDSKPFFHSFRTATLIGARLGETSSLSWPAHRSSRGQATAGHPVLRSLPVMASTCHSPALGLPDHPLSRMMTAERHHQAAYSSTHECPVGSRHGMPPNFRPALAFDTCGARPHW